MLVELSSAGLAAQPHSHWTPVKRYHRNSSTLNVRLPHHHPMRWRRVVDSLSDQIVDRRSFERAVCDYVSPMIPSAERFHAVEANERYMTSFFPEDFEAVRRLALSITTQFPTPFQFMLAVPMNKSFAMTFSQQQLAALVANMFMCTFEVG